MVGIETSWCENCGGETPTNREDGTCSVCHYSKSLPRPQKIGDTPKSDASRPL